MKHENNTEDAYHGKVPMLVREMRRRVIDGVYSPGQRLPTRAELVAHYGFSSLTVQRAMNLLEADGFVESQGRNGTYVSKNPPHLTRYAIMFPYRREDHWWSHLYKAIEMECLEMEDDQTSFFFVCGYDTAHGAEDFRDLVNDVENERVAGLIFASDPHSLVGTPILEKPGLPRVAFMSDVMAGVAVKAITLTPDVFLNRALDYLESQGRKRPALIFHANVENRYWQTAQAKVTARGMACPSRWVHGVTLDNPAWTEHIVRLLFTATNRDRPDSLIVEDDNLLPAVGQGLLAEHVMVPEDVLVVGGANFPWPTPSAVPAKRFGIDIRNFLETAVDIIGKERRNESVPDVTFMPIVDERVMERYDNKETVKILDS